MNLRDYQKECIDIIQAQKPGAYLIQMATGLGKTVTFANLPRHGRMLILSHREELVHQPEKYFDCPFGIERGPEHSNGEEVVSASVHCWVLRLPRTVRIMSGWMMFFPRSFSSVTYVGESGMVISRMFPAGG